ncbi:TetR/AcrR family transcriptional regulator [Streptomyces sp. NPDC057565]|uniref:TetR/AcrR family transcriptional regulator n=1 Tax=Streptomyces sp. NPDC057565 TaxID=3346169 RepID=UPI0036CA90CB
MGAQTTRRDQVATDRRRAILEGAARLIARRGVRGLRVEELAAEADVSAALIYYHFKNRAGILLSTLEFISDRAERYTAERNDPTKPSNPRRELEQSFLLELQDLPEVRENSIAWGELRASAVFDPALRGDLTKAGLTWVLEVAELLGGAHPTAPATALAASAERLTSLLEGLSARWLSGVLSLKHARELMREAIAVETGQLDDLRAAATPPSLTPGSPTLNARPSLTQRRQFD